MTEALIKRHANYHRFMRRMAREIVAYALARSGNDQTRAAELMCLERPALKRIIKDAEVKLSGGV